MNSPSARRLPIFPLNTVLFPGGPLPLRIFEPRYVQMVRDCTANDSEFGVCLIVEGEEGSTPTSTVQIGTTARIVDFYSLEDGLLGITARGDRRFKIETVNVQHDGLIVGEVSGLPEDDDQAVADEHLLLAQVAERLLEQIDGLYPNVDKTLLNNAGWVSNRLGELLPFERMEKQALMEIDDPYRRMQQVAKLMPRFQKDG